MTGDDTAVQIQRLVGAMEEAARHLSQAAGSDIRPTDIEHALVDHFHLDSAIDLLDRQLSSAEIVRELASFDFRRLRPQLLEQVELQASIIPDGVQRLLSEERIRLRGEIWMVHKNAADPFPSIPHAHNSSSGHTLHLGTGKLYLQRDEVGRVSRKHCSSSVS